MRMFKKMFLCWVLNKHNLGDPDKITNWDSEHVWCEDCGASFIIYRNGYGVHYWKSGKYNRK
jgi:hypothetical protein